MREQLQRWLASGSVKAKAIFALLGAIALERALKWWVPEGEEGNFLIRALQWLRDALTDLRTDWLIVALVTAIGLYGWDERKRWMAAIGRRIGAATSLWPKRSHLRLCFEPREPYVLHIPNASTWPKGTSPTYPRDKWVKTDTVWYRVLPVNDRAHHIVRGVKVFLTGVERLVDGKFVDLGIGTQMQLRWASDVKRPFDTRDIGPLDKFYVDILSVGDQHNKVFIKWPPHVLWLANEALFEEAGIYRLTVTATSSDGVASEIKLGFLWPRRWDKTEMWVDGEGVAREMADRLQKYLTEAPTHEPQVSP